MDAKSEIAIHRMIIHKVDHWNYKAPQLSDLESPVSDEVSSFLQQHIAANREHRFARTAVFEKGALGDDKLRDTCDALLNDPQSFVAHSRQIATRLFQTANKRISPGDLVVCTYSEDDTVDDVALALLKMDPEDGFVGETEDVAGQVRIVLRRVPNVLPTGELQKCAFVLPPSQRSTKGYDLKVLDQQAARFGTHKLVASFFTKNFLQCRVNLDPGDKTVAFVYGSHEWIEQKHGLWTEDDIVAFKDQTNDSLGNKTVDVTAFAQAIIPDPDEQDQYLDYLRRQGLEDLTFEPDPEERRKLTQYAWFEGDNELLVRINADEVGPGKTLIPHKDEGTNTWTVTIRTTKWSPKVKRGRR